MEWVLLLGILIWFVIYMRKIFSFKFDLPPDSIEIKPIKGLKKLSDNLEESLNNVFMGNVEERVRENNKLKENEYEWRLLDLKRYFIMTYLLKESPMFSGKVDELWHEMLMFTREYEGFSNNYIGTTLHHSPNINVEPDPDLRAFFDWVYAELFFIRKENIHLYKGFFRYPVHPNVIEEFKNLPEVELIEKYFKSNTKYTTTISTLISSMKKAADDVKNYDKSVIRDMVYKRKNKQNFNALLGPFLSVSYFHYDEFSSYMNIKDNSSSSSSGCSSATYCSSCSSDSSNSSCGGGGD